MDVFSIVLAVLFALGIGALVGFFLSRHSVLGVGLKRALEESSRVLLDAEETKKVVLLEAKEEALNIRTSAEADLRERRSELQNHERRLSNREENLERRSETLDRQDKDQLIREKDLGEARIEVDQLKASEV